MQYTLSDKSQKSLNALMRKWFALTASVLFYLCICYIVFVTEAFTPPFTIEILQKNLFSGMTLHAALYLIAAIVFIGGDVYSKYSYKKLLAEAMNQKFKTSENEFNFFRTNYATIMFVHIGIFNVIALLGVIVFFLTFDLTTLINLLIISLLGCILMFPHKTKLTFPVEKAYPMKK